jgi:hypothetical protein
MAIDARSTARSRLPVGPEGGGSRLTSKLGPSARRPASNAAWRSSSVDGGQLLNLSQ